MSATLKSTEMGHLGSKFRQEGVEDVSQIITQFGREMELSCAK